MKYIKGDLIKLFQEGQFDIIAHGCNCMNTWGAGIAKALKEAYSQAYLVDSCTSKGDKDKLGKISFAFVNRSGKAFEEAGMVINAYTQYSYGRDKVHVDYQALESAFKQIKLLFDWNCANPPSIGIPQIGSGLAGGDWEKIEKIIDRIGFNDLTCVLFEQTTD